jgi:CDP-4-dehydro-6-deoxyglucose reductase/3-phenylpropionate/trans-cinnamate dioxygenase ferredoxin reductase subunit
LLSFTITIANSSIAFGCASDETVLDASERAGYSIPYSCRKGVCSSCAGELISGRAVVRGQGVCSGPASGVLLCQARPQTDLEILPVRIRSAQIIERKIFTAKIRKIERPAPDVAIIHLRLLIGRRAIFQAGQYLRVLMGDGDSRNYSMANPPQKNDEVELHIRHVPGGKFSENILARLDKTSTLDLELPYGEFSLSDASDTPAILIATGTGFAPMKSIIENNIRQGLTRPLHLYWGANTEADLYMAQLARGWADTHAWFDFTPVVSSPSPQWSGRTGLVHRAVQADYPNMSELEVYACGAPIMIDSAQRDFRAESKLGHDAFFSDAFVPSGEVGASNSAVA